MGWRTRFYKVNVNGVVRIILAGSNKVAVARAIKWAGDDHPEIKTEKIGTSLHIYCERLRDDDEEVKQTKEYLEAKREKHG